MEIDLKNIPSGIMETNLENCQFKSNRIIASLNRFNCVVNESRHNCIIIPMSLYNIIECSYNFKHVSNIKIGGITYVGDLSNFKCYLDLIMCPNELIMSYDKISMRNSKLDYILEGSNILIDKVVNIIY